MLEELSKRDLWIVIGYSFRDPVIRTMFEKSLQEKTNRKLLLVLPNADEVKKLFSQNIQNQIFEVKDYFGRSNYKIVNANIIQQLIKIS